MKIIIIKPGKSKGKHWLSAEKEYEKRLATYTRLDLISIQEEKAKGKLSTGDIEKIMDREAASILKKLPSSSFLILLDPKGIELSSEDFADFLDKKKLASTKNLVFVIGGFLGHSEKLIE